IICMQPRRSRRQTSGTWSGTVSAPLPSVSSCFGSSRSRDEETKASLLPTRAVRAMTSVSGLLDLVIPPESVVRTRLANGLRALMRRDTSAPVVAIVTFVKAGYFDETDDIVGISHVLEHMYFKGTPTRGVGEIARDTKASGGYLNAATIYDHTHYYAVMPSPGFAAGLAVQAAAYANSIIDAGALSRELEALIEEAKRKADNPSA